MRVPTSAMPAERAAASVSQGAPSTAAAADAAAAKDVDDGGVILSAEATTPSMPLRCLERATA
jgi:hypothetical protein